MKEAKLADDIMAALKKGPAPDEVMSLGSMYVEAMGEARRRLEQCVDLIRKGKESAALQEAQFAPPLMDLVDTLSFPKSREWTQLMEQSGIPAGAGFDATHLEMVGALYVKKIDGSDPLYRDLAQAMREKDFDKALVILQLIRRKNPQDANATAQHENVEKRVQEERLQRLVTLADADDERGFTQFMGRFEAVPWDKEPQGPKWDRSLAYKAELEHRQAFAKCLASLDAVKEARQANDWKSASRSLTSARSLLDAYRFTLDDLYRGLMDDAAAWVRQEATLEKEAQAAEVRLNRLRGTLRKIQDKELGRKRTSTEIREDLAELTSVARDLQEARQSLPENELQTFNLTLEKLRKEISRRQKRRRLLIAAGCAALLAIAIPAFLAISASMERSDLLEELRAGVDEISKVNELQTFLDSFSGKNPEREADPDFAVLLKRGRGKVTEETKRWENFQKKARELQFQVGEIEDPTALIPLGKQRQALVVESQRLNDSFSEQAKAALDELELQWNLKRDSVQQGISGELGAMLKKVQRFADMNATLSMAASQLEKNLDRLNEDLVSLEEKQRPFEPTEGVVGLTDGQKDLLGGVRETYESRKATLQSYERHKKSLDTASSEALLLQLAEDFMQTGLTNDPFVKAAQALLLRKGALSDLPASVFLPMAPSRWASLTDEISVECMPETLATAEKGKFNELFDENRVKAVYERKALVISKPASARLEYKEEGWSLLSKYSPKTYYTLGEASEWSDIEFVPGTGSGKYKLVQTIQAITPDGVEKKSFTSKSFTSEWRGVNRELEEKEGTEVSLEGELLLESKNPVSDTVFFPDRPKLTPESSYIFKSPGDGKLETLLQANWSEVDRSFLHFLDELKSESIGIDPLVKAFIHLSFMEAMNLRPLKWGLRNSPTTKMAVLKDYDELMGLVAGGDLVGQWHSHLLGDTPPLRQQLQSFYQRARARSYYKEARFWASFWQQVQPSKFLFHGYCKMDGSWSKSLPAGTHAWGISTKTGDFRIVREGAGEALPLSPLFIYEKNFLVVLDKARRFAEMRSATDPEYLGLKPNLPYPFNLAPE